MVETNRVEIAAGKARADGGIGFVEGGFIGRVGRLRETGDGSGQKKKGQDRPEIQSHGWGLYGRDSTVQIKFQAGGEGSLIGGVGK